MSRIPYLTDDAMTERQRRRSQELQATRGGGRVTGPGAFWVYNPDISECAEPMRQHMEQGTSLPLAVSELAILTTARHWSATYAWCRHEGRTLKEGVEAAAIANLRDAQPAIFAEERAAIVYAVAQMLLGTGGLDDATYRRALDFFGLPALIELVGEVGYGSLVSLANATFEPDPPDGSRDYLPPGPQPPRPLGWPSHGPRLEPTDFHAPGAGVIGVAAAAWHRRPAILACALRYDEVLRQRLTLEPATVWLIVLFVARYWHARSLWADLQRQALENGLSDRTADALALAAQPAGLNPEQAIAYDFAHDLLTTGRPGDAVFASARETLGLTNMIEIAAIVGFMAMVTLTANVFGPDAVTWSDRNAS